MCPMQTKCAGVFVAGVFCFYCTLGFKCQYKENEFAETFLHGEPRYGYIPEPTKDSVTVVASGSNIQTPSGAYLVKTQADPIIEGNQLHYFNFKLTSGGKEEEGE